MRPPPNPRPNRIPQFVRECDRRGRFTLASVIALRRPSSTFDDRTIQPNPTEHMSPKPAHNNIRSATAKHAHQHEFRPSRSGRPGGGSAMRASTCLPRAALRWSPSARTTRVTANGRGARVCVCVCDTGAVHNLRATWRVRHGRRNQQYGDANNTTTTTATIHWFAMSCGSLTDMRRRRRRKRRCRDRSECRAGLRWPHGRVAAWPRGRTIIFSVQTDSSCASPKKRERARVRIANRRAAIKTR